MEKLNAFYSLLKRINDFLAFFSPMFELWEKKNFARKKPQITPVFQETPTQKKRIRRGYTVSEVKWDQQRKWCESCRRPCNSILADNIGIRNRIFSIRFRLCLAHCHMWFSFGMCWVCQQHLISLAFTIFWSFSSRAHTHTHIHPHKIQAYFPETRLQVSTKKCQANFF